ncbi:MAG: hypothetical protein IJ833_01275 [Lachnospiraceae bacterium]|nr:hypothetical protein [Lachnospiraceae bacterium]
MSEMETREAARYEQLQIMKRFNELGKSIEEIVKASEPDEVKLERLLAAQGIVVEVYEILQSVYADTALPELILRYSDVLIKIAESMERREDNTSRNLRLLEEFRVRMIEKMQQIMLEEHSSNGFMDKPKFQRFVGTFRKIAFSRFRDEGLEEQLRGFSKVYLWEAEQESILTYMYLLNDGKGELITGFLGEGDEGYLLDKPVWGIQQIAISEEDAVIVCATDPIRQDDIEYLRQCGVTNIVELNVYDARTYEFFVALDEKAYQNELTFWFEQSMGKPMDWEHPVGWNEGIQWTKLYERDPMKTRLADKYLVRDWIKETIGEQYLIPMYGVWNHFDEIPFEKLPNQFVLKCNHGSGTNLIVNDKRELDIPSAREMFENWLHMNYAFVNGFELQYKDIKPCILAEHRLEPKGRDELEDYKVFVFHGEAKFIQVDVGRFTQHRRNLYSREWELLPYGIGFPTAWDVKIKKPACLEELLRLAEILGKDFRHVRVDFYIVENRIYFGEMTFTHGSGIEKVTPESFNVEMGKWMFE